MLYLSQRAELSLCLQPVLLVLYHFRCFSLQISLSYCICLAYPRLQCAEGWNGVLKVTETVKLLQLMLQNFLLSLLFFFFLKGIAY